MKTYIQLICVAVLLLSSCSEPEKPWYEVISDNTVEVDGVSHSVVFYNAQNGNTSIVADTMQIYYSCFLNFPETAYPFDLFISSQSNIFPTTGTENLENYISHLNGYFYYTDSIFSGSKIDYRDDSSGFTYESMKANNIGKIFSISNVHFNSTTDRYDFTLLFEVDCKLNPLMEDKKSLRGKVNVSYDPFL